MIARLALLFFFVAFGAAHYLHDTGTWDLSLLMANTCCADAGCRAEYVYQITQCELDTEPLARDMRAILASHGFTNSTCTVLLTIPGMPLMLAKDLKVVCADPQLVAQSRTTLYTVGVAATVLCFAVVTMVVLFCMAMPAVVPTRSTKQQRRHE
jgi:hypothetical protein